MRSIHQQNLRRASRCTREVQGRERTLRGVAPSGCVLPAVDLDSCLQFKAQRPRGPPLSASCVRRNSRSGWFSRAVHQGSHVGAHETSDFRVLRTKCESAQVFSELRLFACARLNEAPRSAGFHLMEPPIPPPPPPLPTTPELPSTLDELVWTGAGRPDAVAVRGAAPAWGLSAGSGVRGGSVPRSHAMERHQERGANPKQQLQKF